MPGGKRVVPFGSQALYPAVRVAIFAGFVLAGLWILWSFLSAIAWATILAIVIWPLYDHITGSHFARRHASIVTPLLVTLVIGIMVVGPLAAASLQVGREASALLHQATEIARAGIPAPDWLLRLTGAGHSLAAWWQVHLGRPGAISDLLNHVNSTAIVAWSGTLGVQLARRAALFLLTLLTLFFLLLKGPALIVQIAALADYILGRESEMLAMPIIATVRGTVNGLVLVGVGEAVLLGATAAVVGLPHPVLFGALTAVLAIVPFGAPIAVTAGCLVLLSMGLLASSGFLFGVGMVVIFIADHFVRPVFISGTTRLPFLWVLLGILGGLERFGLLGLFLGPAVMATLVGLWREWVKAALPVDVLHD
jgi:predicted PurR-regulated permease PerM